MKEKKKLADVVVPGGKSSAETSTLKNHQKKMDKD
jgi:hypothetical protein